MMMLQTGMRPEEVYRIQPENVHLSKAYFGKSIRQDESRAETNQSDESRVEDFEASDG